MPLDGRGPNPLLQNHPLMAFHPPMLYLGYVGFTVPFSFAMAALITGRFGEGWLADTRRTTLVAWGFLTVGIILGAWWSYEVLGWGGYWGWDPVENASLLPWITATAFIHSVMVQERRGMLRVWNLSLVIATFALTILGTFLTRSGIVTSVHAFSQSAIGPWLLTFLFIVMFTGVGLIAWRADKLHAPGRIDSPVSREAAFLANNLLFAALAFVVLLGTVFPLLAEALRGSTLSVGEPYFDRMGAPIGLMLLFLMAIAPALPWRATSGDVLQHRLLRARGGRASPRCCSPSCCGRATGPRWWRSDSPRSPSSRSAARRSSRCGPAGASTAAAGSARWVGPTPGTRGATAVSSCTPAWSRSRSCSRRVARSGRSRKSA